MLESFRINQNPGQLKDLDLETMKKNFMEFPPSPPSSDKSSDADESSCLSSLHDGEESIEAELADFPLPPPSNVPTLNVLDIDAKTPDFHVARDPRVIRLTGVHPFNVEPPLTTLMEQGFLTPPELFYVRNHGAVPRVYDDEIPNWEISIGGLVDNPITITFAQILSEFEQLTLPITLVCAGNRRKEQNQVRKSQGFSWGSAGLSTALFTGPMLSDIIKQAKPQKRAKFLCMEGADQLPNGNYGTSINLGWVMNRERGILLAHKMNGEPLTPDHGRPIRVVVPCQIGGRSVKWLKRIILTDEPSDNWYHKYDNRVLPTMVTPEMSKQDDSWWTDPRYAIYDLSVNSAIAYPEHEETIELSSYPETYTIKGYAYTGGMRRVTRVEISLDKGDTWALADIEYPEDRYREVEMNLYGGKIDMASREAVYCWCFWKIKISIENLKKAEDIVARGMDDSMTIQPRDMYWSVLGMMNNPWFRIAIRRDKEGFLRFEHPTQPALMKGGWMERVKKEGGSFSNGNWGEKVAGVEETRKIESSTPEEVKMTNDSIKRIIEIEELGEHEVADSPWFVVNGEVYDGKGFLKEHPGGAQSIISSAGTDASDEFLAIHSESAKSMMVGYHIGTLSAVARTTLATPAAVTQSQVPREKFLNPRAWASSKLVAKKEVSWDTRIFSFKLESEEQLLGLPIGQHLMIKIRDQKTNEMIVRAYTPISPDRNNGTVDLLVKVYFETPESRGGKMTMAMDALPIGHDVELKGPLGKLEYLGGGQVSVSDVTRTVSSFCMLCAGTGITPIFQVLRAVMEDPEDPTHCVVLDGNRLEEDILCREELDSYLSANPERMQLVHTLSKPCISWDGRQGRVDKELIEKYAPTGKDTLFLICGPGPFEKSVRGILSSMGWSESDMVFF